MRNLFFLAFLIIVGSCAKDLDVDEGLLLLEDKKLVIGGEEFFFKGTDKGYYITNVDEIYMPADLVDYEQMVFNSQNESELRGATTTNKWSCNKIYYKFHSNVSTSKRNEILAIFNSIENRTRLDFQYAAHSAPRSTYVFIEQISGDGGRSTVGKTSAPSMEIGSASSPREVLHEIGHVVGLHHEHQRANGENDLDYFYWNTQWGKWKWIKPLSYATPRGALDFASVMMYHSCAAAKDQGGVLGCDAEDATHLRNNGFMVTVNTAAGDYSSGDISAMNDLYNTNASCGGGGGPGPGGGGPPQQ